MNVLVELLYGFIDLFLQPLFYLFLLFAFFINARRVKQERRDFHISVYSIAQGLIRMVIPGLILGLVGSLVLLAIGVVVPPGMLVLIAALYLLGLLTLQLRLVTPGYALAFAALIAYFLPSIHTNIEIIDEWINDIQTTPLTSIALLLGVLLIVEGVLIRLWGAKMTTPRLLTGKRGKRIGAHEASVFWLVPFFLFLPNGMIPGMGWWPLTFGGSDGVSLLLVPFGFGFAHLMVNEMPQKVVASSARWSLSIGFAVLIFASIGWYTDMSVLSIIAAAVAVLARISYGLIGKYRQKQDVSYYKQRDDGLTVLGILPGSPAEKMGIRVGECIHKVNGRRIRNEQDFYSALQANGAFCKIEVMDEKGEIRFAQGALYEGSHHELGLLFVV